MKIYKVIAMGIMLSLLVATSAVAGGNRGNGRYNGIHNQRNVTVVNVNRGYNRGYRGYNRGYRGPVGYVGAVPVYGRRIGHQAYNNVLAVNQVMAVAGLADQLVGNQFQRNMQQTQMNRDYYLQREQMNQNQQRLNQDAQLQYQLGAQQERIYQLELELQKQNQR